MLASVNFSVASGNGEGSKAKAVEAQVTTLDEFFKSRAKDLKRLQFVKVDVEGHELNVIQGMRQIFKRGYRPRLMTEVSIVGKYRDDLEEYAGLLAKLGYRLHALRPKVLESIRLEELPPGFHGNVFWLPRLSGF